MARKKREISILDVTIRDGSYTINYQYTPAQVAAVAAALDQAGIDCIEVSHGCGLGAVANLRLPAAASDAEYVRAAKGAVKRAKVGVIAGAAPSTQQKDIDEVIDEVDFIRFAANCDNPAVVAENIKYSRRKRPNLKIFFQLMRSTRRPKAALLKAGRQIEDMGADLLYIVDTAGHFIPDEVGDFTSALTAKLKIAIGFHGHNNLGLAVANTLAAVEAGAKSVDASLKGMGRAGGNAQLEAVVSLLHRRGLARDIDLDRLLVAAEELIAPIMPPSCGINLVDVLTADANIDLYPLSLYERIAEAAGIGFVEFVREMASDDAMVEAGVAEIERALKTLGGDVARAFAAVGIRKP
ncbi:MAG: hypothetical protein V2A66_11120 [Pseudomonadota bacterium]